MDSRVGFGLRQRRYQRRGARPWGRVGGHSRTSQVKRINQTTEIMYLAGPQGGPLPQARLGREGGPGRGLLPEPAAQHARPDGPHELCQDARQGSRRHRKRGDTPSGDPQTAMPCRRRSSGSGVTSECSGLGVREVWKLLVKNARSVPLGTDFPVQGISMYDGFPCTRDVSLQGIFLHKVIIFLFSFFP